MEGIAFVLSLIPWEDNELFLPLYLAMMLRTSLTFDFSSLGSAINFRTSASRHSIRMPVILPGYSSSRTATRGKRVSLIDSSLSLGDKDPVSIS